jgi:hypothetical protein
MDRLLTFYAGMLGNFCTPHHQFRLDSVTRVFHRHVPVSGLCLVGAITLLK